MTYGGSRYGGAPYGGTQATLTADPPADPPVLPWDPDAPTPSDPPSATPTVPEGTFELLERDGTHVAWLDKGIALLCRRDAKAPGSASATLLRSLSLAAELRSPRMLRVRYRGKVVHDALIRPYEDTLADRGETGSQTTTVRAAGSLSILDDVTVGPWSETSLPAQDTQRFDFTHPMFVPGAGWVFATELAAQSATTEHWTGLPPKWRAPTSKWIAGSTDTTDHAAGGDFFGLRTVVLPYGLYAVSWTMDDAGEVYIDNVLQGVARDFHGFTEVEKKISGGQHTFATHWGNIAQDVDNPTGFQFAMQTIDAAGRRSDPVLISDSSWRLLIRPASMPGWEVGRILNYLLDVYTAKTGQVIHRSFTDLLDTAGNAWPVLTSWSIPTDALIGAALEKMAETYIDVRMRAGSFTLDCWNKGTRGTARTAPLRSGFEAGITDARLTSLRSTTQPPYATRIIAHTAAGYVPRGSGFPERPLSLPNVTSVPEAISILDELLTIYGSERTQWTAGLHIARDDDETDPNTLCPFFGMEEADTVNLVAAASPPVLQSITMEITDEGTKFPLLEMGDVLFDDEERVHRTLRQMAEGAFGGRSSQATSTRVEAYQPPVAAVTDTIVIHRSAASSEVESDPKRPSVTGRIVEFPVTLGGTIPAGAHDVELLRDGTVIATTTVPDGETWATTHHSITTEKGVGDLTVSCDDLGFSITAEIVQE